MPEPAILRLKPSIRPSRRLRRRKGTLRFFDEYAEVSLADIAIGPEPGFETEERLTALGRRWRASRVR